MKEEDFTNQRRCIPTDGLYEKGHIECEACCEMRRKCCEIFALSLDRQFGEDEKDLMKRLGKGVVKRYRYTQVT